MSRRDELLKATQAASRVSRQFAPGPRTSFDIVGAVEGLNVPLLFRPLSGLLGATLTIDDDTYGIIVTTQRDLHVQRFTTAHELGHLLLGHHTQIDLDDQVWARGPKDGPRDIKEEAADVFASEVLASRPLLLKIAKRHQWTRSRLLEPEVAYQLSLRLGLSYEATCWSLVQQGVIEHSQAKTLRAMTPKAIKGNAFPDKLEDPWANVWVLSSEDDGTLLEASPNDVFAMAVEEDTSTGFRWALIDPGETAVLVGEERVPPPGSYGGSRTRVKYVTFSEPGVHRLLFEHRRSWNQTSIASIDIAVSTLGKEHPGLPRRTREVLIGSA